jgi:hypothetical protein
VPRTRGLTRATLVKGPNRTGVEWSERGRLRRRGAGLHRVPPAADAWSNCSTCCETTVTMTIPDRAGPPTGRDEDSRRRTAAYGCAFRLWVTPGNRIGPILDDSCNIPAAGAAGRVA